MYTKYTFFIVIIHLNFISRHWNQELICKRNSYISIYQLLDSTWYDDMGVWMMDSGELNEKK